MSDFRIRFLFCLALIILLGGCKPDGFDDNPSVEVPEDIPQDKPAYEILTDDTYSFKEFIHTLIDESSLTSSIPDAMKILLEAQIDTYIDNLAATVGVAPGELWFRRVTYLYPSIDQYGSQRSLSAMALWLGAKADEEWTDISPDRICLMEHFTIASDAECPSVGYPFEAFINGNSLVLMPDYIGYGATADMVHPYMNHELCAVNSIDALEAGYKLFEELSMAEMTPGWTTSVAGASQGGGNALAVHKYMDTHSDVSQYWNFTHSCCAAGPYSPSLTVDIYLEEGTTANPVLFTLTLKSMYDSYPDILGKFDESRFYSERFLEHKEVLDAALDSRKYTTSEMNDLYFSFLMPEGEETTGGLLRIEDILSAEIMDKDSEICKALYECLEKSDLIKGWIPVKPMKLYFSYSDSVVPAENTLAVFDAFGESKVTLEPSLLMDHTLNCVYWMLDVMSHSENTTRKY